MLIGFKAITLCSISYKPSCLPRSAYLKVLRQQMGRRNALALESSMLMEYSVDIRPQYSLKAGVSRGDTMLNVFPGGQVAIKEESPK